MTPPSRAWMHRGFGRAETHFPVPTYLPAIFSLSCTRERGSWRSARSCLDDCLLYTLRVGAPPKKALDDNSIAQGRAHFLTHPGGRDEWARISVASLHLTKQNRQAHSLHFVRPSDILHHLTKQNRPIAFPSGE